jgi:glycerol-3-phosphate dehydrogenase
VANSARVVNAGGVWVDELLGKVQAKPADVERKIGGTKGSHLVVRKFPGGPENALYVEAREDGRPFFIIPWQKDYYLIGTTDLPYKGDLDKVVADEDEIAYLKRETRRIFPKAELDILYTYSGVRPLPYAGNKKAGKITRKHIIWDHGVKDGIQGLLSIIGGKLTTYRNLAEETVDLLVKQLKLKVKPCDTRTTPLPGGAGIAKLAQYKKDTVPQASQTYNVPSETVDYLIDVYGSRYREVLELTRENSVWARPLVPGNPAIQAQVIHAVRNEFACSSADVLMRRTGLALREGVGLDAAETTARLIAQELGWTSEQLQADLTQYRQTVLTLNHPVQYASQPAESARS